MLTNREEYQHVLSLVQSVDIVQISFILIIENPLELHKKRKTVYDKLMTNIFVENSGINELTSMFIVGIYSF